MVVARFVQTGDQVRRSRPGGPGAYPKPTGQFGLTGGGERRPFLMSHPEPGESLFAPDRISERIERIAHDTEHLSDAQFRQRRGQQLAHCL